MYLIIAYDMPAAAGYPFVVLKEAGFLCPAAAELPTKILANTRG